MAINDCRAEHQVAIEHLHQDITRLTQRNERLQAKHVDTVVALKEQKCISQSAQDSLTHLTQWNDRLQAEHIDTIVALKEQQCVSQAAQDSLARAIQA